MYTISLYFNPKKAGRSPYYFSKMIVSKESEALVFGERPGYRKLQFSWNFIKSFLSFHWL